MSFFSKLQRKIVQMPAKWKVRTLRNPKRVRVRFRDRDRVRVRATSL